MQEPTHILAGVIIQKTFERLRPRVLALTLTGVTAFLSHGFLDELARITYHPADPDFKSVFWVTYHSVILVTTILFLYWWWRRFKWGIFFAALPDLDWVFIHGQQLFGVKLSFYQHPHMHDLLPVIWHQVPPFSWITLQLEQLPNYRHNPLACLCEFVLIAILLLIIRLMTMARRPERAPENSEVS